MKVVQIINQLGRGGAERQLMLLQQGLRKRGVESTILSIYSNLDILSDFSSPKKLYVVGKRHKFDLFTLFRMARLIQKEEPDIVQTWLPASNIIGTLAAKLAGCNVIINSVRGIDDFKIPVRIAFEQLLHKFVRKTVVNSKRVQDYLIKHEKLNASKIQVIYNGISNYYFQDVKKEKKEELRNQLKISKNTVVVTIIANLREPIKCHEVFLRAAALIHNEMSSVIFLVVGEGPLETEYRELCRQLDIERAVKFLGSRKDIRSILSITSLKVLTSRIEGLPNCLIEALAAGVPIVATDAGGCREVVGEDGLCGSIVPVGDYRAVARESINFLRKTMEERLHMKRQCIQRAQSLFSADKMVERYIGLYEELSGF